MNSALSLARAEAMRRFKPYPVYKDSAVEWLDDVPAHWQTVPLKHVANFINGFAFKPDEWGLDGTPIIRIENLNGGETFNCTTRTLPAKYCADKGDLLFGWSGNRGTSFGPFLWWRPGRHYVNQHIFRIADYAVGKVWLYWALRGVTLYAEKQAHGIIGMVHITRGELGSISIPMVPKEEQQRIASFLDAETEKIDALIAKKERLTELLQERRAALITRAVTKGFDPNVAMKDSGVEWLGQIPAHWEVKRLWHLTPSHRRIMYGIVLPGPNVDDGIPIVKGGDVSPERLRLDRLNRTTREVEAGYVRSRLLGGDLVFAIRGSIGEVAMVPDELSGANITQDAARIAYTRAIHGPWLLQALKSSVLFAQLESGALGATIRGINIRDLKRACIVVPPPLEQRAIATFLNREIARLDALVVKVREAIDRLKELRTALISVAVTGKIDVREVGA